jgi:transposase-like protein
MMKDGETTSTWFVLNSGFKVQATCPACHSPNVSYYRTRVPGLKGISHNSHGFTPACLDCGKNLPNQREKNAKRAIPRKKKFRIA